MKILVTGASGYIGHQLALTLAQRGNEVNVLVSNPGSVNVPQHKNIREFTGDITDRESITAAMHDCEQVFHTAALIKVPAKDPSEFYKVNVEGTRNVLSKALETGIKKLVFTSSCGVLAAPQNEPGCENDPRTTLFDNDYEFTKFLAEHLVKEYIRKGLFSIIVSLSKVFGPGIETHPISVNRVIKTFIKGRPAFSLKPGSLVNNYCFIDDVVEGHILAMSKGISGEKYILGGENISYADLFKTIRSLTGTKAKLIQAPRYLTQTLSVLQWMQCKIISKQPFTSAKTIHRQFCNKTFSSKKAINQLGYHLTPLNEGLLQTIQFLKTQNHA